MKTERLKEIREACGAATPPPWDCDLEPTHAIGGYRQGFAIMGSPRNIGGHRNLFRTCGFADIPQEKANATFVIIARTAVPELLAEVERLEDELHETKQEIERLEDEILSLAKTIDPCS